MFVCIFHYVYTCVLLLFLFSFWGFIFANIVPEVCGGIMIKPLRMTTFYQCCHYFVSYLSNDFVSNLNALLGLIGIYLRWIFVSFSPFIELLKAREVFEVLYKGSGGKYFNSCWSLKEDC